MPSRRTRRSRRGGDLFAPAAAPKSNATTLFTLKGNRNFRHTNPFDGMSDKKVMDFMISMIRSGQLALLDDLVNKANAAYTTENKMSTKYFDMLEKAEKNAAVSMKKIKVNSHWLSKGGRRRSKSRKSRRSH